MAESQVKVNMSSTWMIPKNSIMNYAHVLFDSDDNTVTVFLQQCVTIEETAGSYKMLLETYNKPMHISEAFKDSLQNLKEERAYTYNSINGSDKSQEYRVPLTTKFVVQF